MKHQLKFVLIVINLILLQFAEAQTLLNKALLNRRRASFCLDKSTTVTNRATANICSSATTTTTQQITFNSNNLLLNAASQCLDGSGTSALWATCSTANPVATAQQWQWDNNERLISTSSKNCLTATAETDATILLMSPCSDDPGQKWFRGFNCPPGQTLTIPARDSCANCPSGQFKSAFGNSVCLPCPFNATCSTSGASFFSCDPGFTVNQSKSGCSSCTPSLQYKLTSGNQSCTDCPPGATCPSISSPFTCSAGFHFNAAASSCTQCDVSARKYKPVVSNATSCSDCPVNATCTATQMVCNPGTFWKPETGSCVACESGFFKTMAGNDSCTECPDGASCSSKIAFTCEAGHQLNAAGSGCDPCPLGTAKEVLSNGTCSPCPIGQESSSDRKKCDDCGPRKYRPHFLMDKCVSCPDNSMCSATKFNCSAGYTLNPTTTGCTSCNAGYFKASSGNQTCDQCNVLGTQSNDDFTSCISCPPDLYRPSLSYSSCVACPTGANCTQSSFTCKSNYRINDAGDGCVECPVGREASADRKFCELCKDGSYRSSLSQLQCISCPQNAYCNTTTSFTCSEGYNNPNNEDHCILEHCLPNFYLPAASSVCRKCPENSQCPSEGSFKCLKGFTYNVEANSCFPCQEGYYKSTIDNTPCSACHAGQQPTNDKSGCVNCPPGKYRPVTNNTLLVCIDCPVGAECTTQGFTCKPGYTLSSTNLNQCLRCAKGYYKSSKGNDACSECKVGMFSSDDFISCVSCDEGKFRLSNGQCTSCPIGTEPDITRTTCVKCPNGFYRSNDTMPRCLSCPSEATCSAVEFVCKSGYKLSENGSGCDLIQSESNNINANEGSAGIGIGVTFLVLFIAGGSFYGYAKVYRPYVANKGTASSTDLLFQSNDSKDFKLPTNQVTNPFFGKSNISMIDVTAFSFAGRSTNTDTASRSIKTSIMQDTTEIGMTVPTHLQFIMGTDFKSQKFVSQDENCNIFLGLALNQSLIKAADGIIVKELQRQNNQIDINALYQELGIMYQLKDCKSIAKLCGFSANPYSLLLKYYQLGSLEIWISSRKFIKRKTIVYGFTKDVIQGISYIHERGFAHGALKPINILLDLDENDGKLHCVISGFAMAQNVKEPVKTSRDMVINYSTRAYLAPEMIKQLRFQNKNAQINLQKVDTYALGVLIYQLTSRRLPWSTNS